MSFGSFGKWAWFVSLFFFLFNRVFLVRDVQLELEYGLFRSKPDQVTTLVWCTEAGARVKASV